MTGAFPDGRVKRAAPAGVAETAAVARNLRRALDELGMPISTLADASGVDRSVIHDLLAGRKYLNTQTLARLERATGRPLWEFIGARQS